jgi:hypothetical protein
VKNSYTTPSANATSMNKVKINSNLSTLLPSCSLRQIEIVLATNTPATTVNRSNTFQWSPANLFRKLTALTPANLQLAFPDGRLLKWKKQKALRQFYLSSLNTPAARAHFSSLKFKEKPESAKNKRKRKHLEESESDDDETLIDLRKSDKIFRELRIKIPNDFSKFQQQFIAESKVLDGSLEKVGKRRSRSSKAPNSRKLPKKVVEKALLPKSHGKKEESLSSEDDSDSDSNSEMSDDDSDIDMEAKVNAG